MLMLKASTFPVVLVPRNCARCGRDFGASGREYTCPGCRKPKIRQMRPATRDLSFREKQIVHLIQQAKANKEIAHELCLTTGTVKEYIHRIFQKLDVKNRTELALWAREHPASLSLARKRLVSSL